MEEKALVEMQRFEEEILRTYLVRAGAISSRTDRRADER